jgi:oxygen-dependent protoporphyrinogen oxidase
MGMSGERAPERRPGPADGAPPLDVVVVGAGISGLAAAFRLARGGMRVAVIEASSRPGGALLTREEAGFRFELGPNTVVENDPGLPALIRDCGLEGELLAAAPEARRRYLWHRGRLVPLPGGPLSFLRSPLFPAAAKLRLLREPWAPPPPAGEETVADFVRRRLGQPFLDLVVAPFVSGIYAGDPERLAVRWAVPRIAALEAEHGGLIRGALARRKSSAAPRGRMISLREGIEELPRRLAREVGDVRLGVACRRVLPGGRSGRSGGRFVVEHDGGSVVAERVLLAVPAEAAAALLDEATQGRSKAFAEIPYAAVAVAAAGYRREDVAHPLDGFGFLRTAPSAPTRAGTRGPGESAGPSGASGAGGASGVSGNGDASGARGPSDPRGPRVLGCLFSSSLFPGRAPADHVALTAFLGGRTDPEVATWSDERVAAATHDDLKRALGVRGAPVVSVVHRWPRAIPQYELGHGRFVDLHRDLERDFRGLHLGGNYLHGISVADCVRNALATADRILAGGG